MKWSLYFLLGFVLVFGSCDRNEVRKWSVQYKAFNRGTEEPTFRMTYMLQSGATKSVGPITTRHWESEILDEFEGGKPVQLEMEIISGNGKFDVEILRDGAVHERGKLEPGDKYLILETNI